MVVLDVQALAFLKGCGLAGRPWMGLGVTAVEGTGFP